MGVIPPLVRADLRMAAAQFGADPDGSGGAPDGASVSWAPPVRQISLTYEVEHALRAALAKSAEITPPPPRPAAATSGAPRGGGGGGGGGGGSGGSGGSGGGGGGGFDSRALLAPPAPPPPQGGGPHGASRAQLPVAEHRAQILAALRRPASVIEGETGSGKTTQVAQYVLEEAHRRRERVSIIVTQPRRIAAIGVAERVAAERGERCGTGVVGYAVRGESCSSAQTQLLFCTTGVLLRRLETDPALGGVTHVLVDEVHERTIEGDFLLLALRNLLEAQGSLDADDGGGSDDGDGDDGDGGSRLRVGLMSATMDGAVLAEYLGHCPRVSFPGRAFPVTAVHLEHAVALCRHRVNPAAEWCRGSQAHARWVARRPSTPDESAEGGNQATDGRGGHTCVPVRVALPESERECARRYADVGSEAATLTLNSNPNPNP